LYHQRQGDLTTGPDRDTTYFYGPPLPTEFLSECAGPLLTRAPEEYG